MQTDSRASKKISMLVRKKSSQNKKAELFWKEHLALFKSSGLSRKHYCDKNNLNYHCFGYWINKRLSQPSLISVKIASPAALDDPKLLCSVKLNNGLMLKIHEISVLPFILAGMH